MSDQETGGGEPPTKRDGMITIAGGVEIEISYLPADAFDEEVLKLLEKFRPLLGTTARVKVREIRVPDAQRYGTAVLLNDEATQIELYCGRDMGWSGILTQASANAIADEGQRINVDFFVAWYRRQAKWKSVQSPPEVQEMLRKFGNLETMVQDLASKISATSSAPTTG